MIAIKNKKLRGIIRYAVPFAAIPATVVLGAVVSGGKQYAYISLVVTVLSLLLFASGYEKKKTGSRRIVIVAIITALSVAGRFIPVFKPVTALTVLTAVCLGSESGFLVGSLSALISGFFFGQGPWTPFQMLAWGLVGFFAGILSPLLRKNRALMAVYGVISGFVFSFIMDVWTVLWYNGDFSLSLYLSALVSALPHTVIYSVSNLVFILLLAKPFCEKLERIKLKYGI